MNSAEFCRAAGITRRMLQWWVNHRIVKRIKGYRWRFDDGELFKALIIRELRARGVTVRKIARLKLTPVKADYLLIVRNRVEWADRQGLIEHIKRVHSPVLLISIHDLRLEYAAAMERPNADGSKPSSGAVPPCGRLYGPPAVAA
jgi:DNA-binding transcriptional MerR regulator